MEGAIISLLILDLFDGALGGTCVMYGICAQNLPTRGFKNVADGRCPSLGTLKRSFEFYAEQSKIARGGVGRASRYKKTLMSYSGFDL
jgi:hypothetical protein